MLLNAFCVFIVIDERKKKLLAFRKIRTLIGLISIASIGFNVIFQYGNSCSSFITNRRQLGSSTWASRCGIVWVQLGKFSKNHYPHSKQLGVVHGTISSFYTQFECTECRNDLILLPRFVTDLEESTWTRVFFGRFWSHKRNREFEQLSTAYSSH